VKSRDAVQQTSGGVAEKRVNSASVGQTQTQQMYSATQQRHRSTATITYHYYYSRLMAGGWRHGAVVSGVRSMNEVNARRARLVLGWVTVFRWVYYLGM